MLKKAVRMDPTNAGAHYVPGNVYIGAWDAAMSLNGNSSSSENSKSDVIAVTL